ncbi:hypothetical protein F969_00577 [Acinetobacter variabilis]|uniref:Uncharacterized protein n=2 Tax=Acinetobacter variabilis TaxID=70346 RepID=N8VLD6_9GAMM|nr:hypothetical protein F969_00577 [Acinetobacter variabilis]
MKTLNGHDVANMVEHWTETPMNGYLGSSYGQNFKSFIQQPQTVVVGNSFIQKLQKDLDILQVLPADAVNLYSVPKGTDGAEVILSVAGRKFNLGEN